MKWIGYVKVGITGLVLIINLSNAYGAQLPQPIFNVTLPEQKQVVEEYIYVINVMRYDPAAAIQYLAASTEASYATPEQALISQFSAMFAKDYNWFLNTWSQEDQNKFIVQDQASGRTPDYWIQIWESLLANRKVEFLNRIESGDYVLIEYRLVSETAPPFSDTVVLKKENNKWVATNELSADPVMQYWKTPEQRNKKLVR